MMVTPESVARATKDCPCPGATFVAAPIVIAERLLLTLTAATSFIFIHSAEVPTGSS